VKCTVRGFTPETGLAVNWATGGVTDEVGRVSGRVGIVSAVVTIGGAVAVMVGVEVTVEVAGPEGCVVQPATAMPRIIQAITNPVSDLIAPTLRVSS
jgi:hypothetical protein